MEDSHRLLRTEFTVNGGLDLPMSESAEAIGVGKHVWDRAPDRVDVLGTVVVRPIGLVGCEDEAPACVQAPKILADVGIGYHAHSFACPVGRGPGDKPNLVTQLLDKVKGIHSQVGKENEGGVGVPFGSGGVEEVIIIERESGVGDQLGLCWWVCKG